MQICMTTPPRRDGFKDRGWITVVGASDWDGANGFLSLPSSGDSPVVAPKEPDPRLMGSALELTSGHRAGLSIGLVVLFVSGSIPLDNGTTFSRACFSRWSEEVLRTFGSPEDG